VRTSALKQRDNGHKEDKRHKQHNEHNAAGIHTRPDRKDEKMGDKNKMSAKRVAAICGAALLVVVVIVLSMARCSSMHPTAAEDTSSEGTLVAVEGGADEEKVSDPRISAYDQTTLDLIAEMEAVS